MDNVALLAAKCGNSAAATAALMEKRFAQSRQELLEQRHQELLRKQRQLQEQYTRLQQLSRGQIPRGFLNDLKKTGSESNLASKAPANVASNYSGAANGSRMGRVPLSSTMHGSLKNLATSGATLSSTLPKSMSPSVLNRSADMTWQNGAAGGGMPASGEPHATKKIFETDIL